MPCQGVVDNWVPTSDYQLRDGKLQRKWVTVTWPHVQREKGEETYHYEWRDVEAE